jgi:hypothetical protein
MQRYKAKPGDYLVCCQRSGETVYRSMCKMQWNNLLVRIKSWEPRQPQDFSRNVVEKMIVSEARPRSESLFVEDFPNEVIS